VAFIGDQRLHPVGRRAADLLDQLIAVRDADRLVVQAGRNAVGALARREHVGEGVGEVEGQVERVDTVDAVAHRRH
jgi:hypothetical protein